MAKRVHINAVVHNFLGTYASRNSAFKGYWLFGWVALETDRLEVNLMDEPQDRNEPTPLAVARSHAVDCFRDQARKGRVGAFIARAMVVVEKLPEPRVRAINGFHRDGFDWRFTVAVISDVGTEHRRVLSVFVAPHGSTVEKRSFMKERPPFYQRVEPSGLLPRFALFLKRWWYERGEA